MKIINIRNLKILIFIICFFGTIAMMLLSMFYRGNGFGTKNTFGDKGYFFLSSSIFLAGISLGIGSSLIQYVNNNSLASPSIIGIFPMASLAWLITYIYGFPSNDLYRSLITLVFTLGILLFYWAIGFAVHNQSSKIILMFIITIFLTSLTFILYAKYGVQKEGAIMFSVDKLNLNSTRFYMSLIMFIIGILIIIPFWKKIMLISLNHQLAKEKGVNVSLYKLIAMIASVFIISSSLCAFGTISFLGLLIPNVSRIIGFEKPFQNMLFSGALIAWILLISYFCSRYFRVDLFALILFVPLILSIPVLFRIRKVGSYEV